MKVFFEPLFGFWGQCGVNLSIFSSHKHDNSLNGGGSFVFLLLTKSSVLKSLFFLGKYHSVMP